MNFSVDQQLGFWNFAQQAPEEIALVDSKGSCPY